MVIIRVGKQEYPGYFLYPVVIVCILCRLCLAAHALNMVATSVAEITRTKLFNNITLINLIF